MGVNEKIKNALEVFGDPVMHGEFAPKTNEPPPKQYYTFEYSTLGAAYADNAPSQERYLIMVHFYCPRTFNSVTRIKQTKVKLFGSGLTWPSMVSASDEDGQHIVFECETSEEVDANDYD